MSGRIASVDAAQQPGYVRSMRRNFRPVFFPAPLPEHRALAERLLRDATQKHVLDFPAIIHAPIENWLVLRLCRTSVTPNQLTLTGALLGAGVTILYAFGYLWAGALLALLFGVLDGLDGKLARLNEQTTEFGKSEHVLDYFVEMSWWTALAYHFHASGQVRYAYAFLIAFIAADFFDRMARRSVEPKLAEVLTRCLASIHSCAVSRAAATSIYGSSRFSFCSARPQSVLFCFVAGESRATCCISSALARSARVAGGNAAVLHFMDPIASLAITGLWVARSKAFPPSCTIFCSSSKARSELAVSRLPVGSSARMTLGSLASARAIATRCCSPPER